MPGSFRLPDRPLDHDDDRDDHYHHDDHGASRDHHSRARYATRDCDDRGEAGPFASIRLP